MKSVEENDINFMRKALELAGRGVGTVSPNPMVGAVVVKNGRIIGEGWHERPGLPHAEPNAIANSSECVEGATIYVTLEPCCHTKKRTPPCSKLLIEKRFKRVVIATLDPNPHVAGNGVRDLEEAGIEVLVGVLEREAKELNETFFKNITTKMPFIHLKLAQTLDGKLSTLTGDSKWITDELARTEVHQMRLKYDAVMVGRNTVNGDNPSLDIRMGIDSKGKVPKRIVVGSAKNLDFSKKILNEGIEHTILITDEEVDGFTCIRNTLKESLKEMNSLGVTSILVEGGGNLASDLLKEGLVDRVTIYVAPKILGIGKSYYEVENQLMKDSLHFSDINLRTLGNQAVFEMKPCSQD